MRAQGRAARTSGLASVLQGRYSLPQDTWPGSKKKGSCGDVLKVLEALLKAFCVSTRHPFALVPKNVKMPFRTHCEIIIIIIKSNTQELHLTEFNV